MIRILSRLTVLAALVCVVALAITGPAFALTPTSTPLAGSDFQGGDGDQDNPASPPGVVDWEAVASTLPNGTDDPVGGDIAFGGGNKETEPINWDTQNEGVGVNPNKDNIISAYSQGRDGIAGSSKTFLNLAFTREASTGNTFATFELNQDGQRWDNGHVLITCRTTGDLLISYEVASGGTPPNVDIVVYKWTTTTLDPNGSGCGATGTLTPLDPQPFAQGAVNAASITNHISGTLANPSLAAGTFGEASLDLTGILPKLRLDVCESFVQATMHTRSSTSIDSQLQDLGRTIPVPVTPCRLKLDKQVSVGDTSHFTDGPQTGYVGQRAYYKVIVTNTGSQPLDVTTEDVGPTCGGDLFTTPTPGVNDLPVTMPDSISAGASKTYYCSHVITSADATAGSYTNTACTSGTHTTTFTNPVESVTVTAQGDPDASALCDTAQVNVHDPHMAIDKQQTLDANGNNLTDNTLVAHVGDVVYYKIVASNTGNTPIAVTATDVNCGGTVYTSIGQQTAVTFPDTIATGGRATYFCRHTLTAADAAANGGDFVNTACLRATDTATPPVAATDAHGATQTCDSVTTHLVVPGTVSGSKYEDKNNNGVFDGADGPLAGVTIYVDYNGNGQLDQGEPTGVSDANGQWSIGGINPGTFNVLEVPVAGYTCTQPATTCAYNLAFASGTAYTGKVFGNAPPQQIVLPARVTPGNARLVGPTGCATRAFNAKVRGAKIQTVTFVLDGKTVKRFTKTVSSGVYAVRINPAKLKAGVHRLAVAVTFQAGSGTKPKSLRLSFQRCAKKLITPRFTG